MSSLSFSDGKVVQDMEALILLSSLKIWLVHSQLFLAIHSFDMKDTDFALNLQMYTFKTYPNSIVSLLYKRKK